ncbi:MAG: hypothetical protein A2156_12020 [Deltaproteobacteria bacterium RBG_16_48_10]|nr:MAG: hypothetical protein A2156_12020 [Deltaproteobacteria bacterium RBG_16_48_10]
MSFKTFSSNRILIWSFAKRDLTGRYKGSFLGAFWSFINPLVLMIIYTIVFAVFLKIRFGDKGSTLHSTLYILAGIVPWMAFQEAVSHSTTVVAENVNLIKKVIFPSEILPVKVALSCLMSQSIGFVILLLGQLLINRELHWTMVQLPPIILFQFVFTLGISWFVASLGVFIKDISQIINLILLVIFFMTPIMYPISIFPPFLVKLIYLNPMTVIITAYRDLILDGVWIGGFTFLKLTGTSTFFFLLGFFWFIKTKKLFVDVI